MANKNSSDLDLAIEEHRANSAPLQPGLPLPSEDAAEFAAPAVKPRGRPLGSTNLRSWELARIYRGRHGDPLEIATEIAGKNVLDPVTVQRLAQTWGCSRFEAVKLWAAINADANRYHHQQMPRAVILNPGAPGGERIAVEIDGQFHQVAEDDDDEPGTESEAA